MADSTPPDDWRDAREIVQLGATPSPRSGRRRWPWFALGGLAVAVAALSVGSYAFAGDRVPHGTHVAGVDIGGLDTEQARAKLSARLAAAAARPVTFTYAGHTLDVDPSTAGLSLDLDQTVDDAGGGRSWNPLRLLTVLTGPDRDVAPAVEVDRSALAGAIGTIADSVDAEMSEGEVRFVGTRPVITQPVVGVTVDQPAAVGAAADAYLSDDVQVELPVVEAQPALAGSELRDFADDRAAPAVATPLRLDLPGQTLLLRPRQFAPALSYGVENGKIVPTIDAELLARRTQPTLARITDKPQDATLVLRAGKPVVVPGRPGVTIDPAEVAAAVRTRAMEPSTRSVSVGTSTAQPEVTARDLKRLGVKEDVSSFVTYFPYAEYRNVNQGRAAELINGTLLMPGDVFSFNGTVGERTKENGFTTGFIISNGVFAEDLGGGVSQVVTTTYNAAFFAGLQDVTHTPHSFYIDRYPLGREATVAWPSVDLKFRNNTPYGLLIHAWVVPSTPSSYGEMHVQMFSTAYWNITAGVSDRYAYTSPDTRYDASDTCVANTGYGGFQVDVYRYFRRVGSSELIRKETDHVVYTPSDSVICSAPPR